MEIIDAHANIGWDASNLRNNLMPIEQKHPLLLEKMDIYDISKAIIVPFPSPGAQLSQQGFWYDLENHYLMEAGKASKRLMPFPGVNPADESSVKNIKTLKTAYGIKGVKFSHQIPMGFSIDKLIKHPLMKIMQDNGLIMMMHIGTGKEQGADRIHTTLNYAVKVARQYPDVKFIFCHLGRLHWSLLEALNLRNVWLDTAGLSLWHRWTAFIAAEPISMLKSSTPAGVIQKLVEMGYEDKLIFGSDEPYTQYKSEIAAISEAEISGIAKRKIFCENIKGLVKQ